MISSRSATVKISVILFSLSAPQSNSSQHAFVHIRSYYRTKAFISTEQKHSLLTSQQKSVMMTAGKCHHLTLLLLWNANSAGVPVAAAPTVNYRFFYCPQYSHLLHLWIQATVTCIAKYRSQRRFTPTGSELRCLRSQTTPEYRLFADDPAQ